MTVQELISELEKLPPEKKVVLFDDSNIPYEVDHVFYINNDHSHDHIVIKSISE